MVVPATAVVPVASCGTRLDAFLRAVADDYLARYERAYACYREQRYHVALQTLSSLRPRNARESVNVLLGRAAVLYQLGRRPEAVHLLVLAQRREAELSGVSLVQVQAPTGGERLLLARNVLAFRRFLPAALAFEFVQQEDVGVKAGVTAAVKGDLCGAARFFRTAIVKERSGSARWLNGAVAYFVGDRDAATASWFDVIFEPQSRTPQQFHAVQWSAVALVIASEA